MVDALGSSVGKVGERRVAPVTRVAATAAPAAPVSPETAPVATAARAMAAEPPVDAARVARIKDAIAKGTFPLSPATIADRLIALKYDWIKNDQA
jgi:negative regulator of flagellin synthesis FlgM